MAITVALVMVGPPWLTRLPPPPEVAFSWTNRSLVGKCFGRGFRSGYCVATAAAPAPSTSTNARTSFFIVVSRGVGCCMKRADFRGGERSRQGARCRYSMGTELIMAFVALHYRQK